jgi:hypothetical protein
MSELISAAVSCAEMDRGLSQLAHQQQHAETRTADVNQILEIEDDPLSPSLYQVG